MNSLIDDNELFGHQFPTGAVRAMRGALAIARSARKHKKRGLILPATNASEAGVGAGLEV
jgi:predicted ATPase with chaperone activity